MNQSVDLDPRHVVGRYHERVVRLGGIVRGDRAHPFLGIGNFVDSALPGETPDGLANLALRQLLDRLLEPWIALTDDLIEPRRCHAGLLKLLEGAPGFDSLVLAPAEPAHRK